MVSQSEYGLDEATRGLKKLDLTDQELRDLEVARKIQEEEIKVRRRTICCLFTTQAQLNTLTIRDGSKKRSSLTKRAAHISVMWANPDCFFPLVIPGQQVARACSPSCPG